MPIFVEHWGDNLQFYPNFALFSTLGGMNLDHDFFQVSKLSYNLSKLSKFLSYNLRNLVFLNKKKLKDSGIVITEALTPQRRACVKRLTELRKKGLIHSNWTVDGKIFYTKPNSTSTKLMIDPPNLDNIDLKFAKQN